MASLDELSPEARALLEFALGRQGRVQSARVKRGEATRKPRLPIGVEKAYERYLWAVARRISREIWKAIRGDLSKARKRQDADLNGLLDEELFMDLRLRINQIVRKATDPAILDQYGTRLNTANDVEMQRVIGVSPVGISAGVTFALEEFRQGNVELITSLAEGSFNQVRTLVSEAANSGMRVETLAKRLEGVIDLPGAGPSQIASRARLIARDQILKTNSQLTGIRARAVGAHTYRWSTSNDDRVREMHADLEGTIHSWADPPVTNPQGDTNNPGEDYECRCIAIPILPE